MDETEKPDVAQAPPLSPGGAGSGLFAGLTMSGMGSSPVVSSESSTMKTPTSTPVIPAKTVQENPTEANTSSNSISVSDPPEMPLGHDHDDTEASEASEASEADPVNPVSRDVESAPVTDKLLGLLNTSPTDSETGTETKPPVNEETESAVMVESPAESTSDKVSVPASNTTTSSTSYSSMFGMSSWFGSPSTNASASATNSEQVTEKTDNASVQKDNITIDSKETDAVDSSPENAPSTEISESPATTAETQPPEKETHPKSVNGTNQDHPEQQSLSVDTETNEAEPPAPSRKEMDVKDQQALDDAFHQEASTALKTPNHQAISTNLEMDAPTDEKRTGAPSTSEKPKAPSQSVPPPAPNANIPTNNHHSHIRGLGHLHPDTPVPNADICLRLLRKFAHKTRPRITTNYGGSKSQSIMSYMFGEKDDPTFVPYRILMEILYESGQELSEELQDESETENIVLGVLGESGNTMDMARRAMAAFCFVFSTWGHASAHQYERKDTKTREGFSDLLAAVFNAASTLVAHGCLDGIVTIIGDDMGGEASEAKAIPIANLFTESVLAADLNPERNELAAMKFLLSAGTRVLDDSGEAMLGGSHLLQTIRMLYHIFLTTESTSNKITARAALQQLVTHVFTRMAIVDTKMKQEPEAAKKWVTEDNFPTEHHRNAFLVLRAICKLSMRSMPDGNGTSNGSTPTHMHSHIGYQTSNSSEMWDGAQQKASSHGSDSSSLPPPTKLHYTNERNSREHAQLIYTSAIHPALESKILALDLIHYVLTHTKFPPGFIMRSGPQFHAAIRNYLCVSLLKNCTSAETHVVNLSLRIFVPLVRNFRTILKNEIEAFVTNVFFVILDSPNSSADHKGIVVRTFDEICSDPATLAEIFLNYDCDLSAQDLFHRIVFTLSKVSRTGLHDTAASSFSIMGGSSASRMEKTRFETRELRLDAMKALRQVLASLHACMVKPMASNAKGSMSREQQVKLVEEALDEVHDDGSPGMTPTNGGVNPVEVYDSKKKRRAEEAEAILRFNQKPTAGISYAAKCGHIDGEDPGDVARYLLSNKDLLDKTMIGEYLGREAEYQNGFCLKVLHEYVRLMDFADLLFDDAIRFFLSGFRLPGEAQKIDRIMEKFAERFTQQNPGLFPTADVAFILSFSIIMLQTDLHNPAIKEERRMTKEGFIRNNRGICDGQDLPEEMLTAIFDRIKANPFSLKEDDDARERAGESKSTSLPTGLSPASFFSSHYEELDREKASNFQKERDHIVRTTESLLKRRRHNSVSESGKVASKQKPKMHKHASQRFVRTEDSGLRDEYVAPMFEASWGPALAAFSTAIESANGTMGLLAIATDEELEIAAENAAETIEVCLTGFRFAICVAGLCGNDVARDSFMSALSRFTMLGSGTLMEPRHVRCIQTMLSLAREDGELIGSAWQHIFRALSEVNRFHQLFHLMARNDRAAAAAAERRRKRLEEKGNRKKLRQMQKAISDENDALPTETEDAAESVTSFDSLDDEDDLFDDDDMDVDEDDMDAKAIDEANSKLVFEGVSEEAIEAIYERSSSLSAPSIKDFVSQLCYVSSLDIRGGGSNKDLNKVSYRQQHALIEKSKNGGDQFHHSPNIFNLQKLVEVAHYNMDSRPRLIFNDLWKEIADHLSLVSLHGNPALAMYAVDSFRQLSVKYLQRDELEVFEFQRRFLKPLETIMAESQQDSTKELLLNCVARIIQVFEMRGPNAKGGLKSGWVPLLLVLGLGSQDPNQSIALMSYNILSTQIEMCTKPDNESVLLSEHFSEAVDAILMGVNGPHSEVSNKALGVCSLLANFLADDTLETQQLKKRSHLAEVPQILDLELWWPLLLGVSKACGDDRPEFRMTAMDTLFGLINDHFFPEENDKGVVDDVVQRLQLVFRGILSPLLEFAEIGTTAKPPPLPKEFERFLTQIPDNGKDAAPTKEPVDWLNTVVDPFMDSCIGMCKRSIEAYQNPSLIEEVFALLNHCIVSDSGALAVRGVKRLEQFVTSDLDQSFVTESVWATVCHMLQKALIVRGIPKKGASGNSTDEEMEEEYDLQVQEFVAEERMLSDRRYVGSHAVRVIDSLLSSDRIASEMGFQWTFFLMNGLGSGIASWEEAASLLDDKVVASKSGIPPPHYLENVMFGRKSLNRFLLQLSAMEAVAKASGGGDSKYKAAQVFVNDETQNLLATYNELVGLVRQGDATELEKLLHVRFAKMAEELVKGYASLPHEHVRSMAWLAQTLLTSCVGSKNESILGAVRKFVQLSETEVGEPLEPPSPQEETANTTDESGATSEPDTLAATEEDETAAVTSEAQAPDATPDLAESPSDEEVVVAAEPSSLAEPDAIPQQEENARQLSADV